MATTLTTEHPYTGDGTTTNYPFSFPYFKEADVKVTLDHVATTAYTFANASTISFTTAPASGVAIRIFRDTDVDAARFVFSSGSALKAGELNENLDQLLYADQERASTDNIADEAVTTAKLRDEAVTVDKLGASAIITAKISDSSITTAKIADSSVTTAKIADDNVTTAKILDANVTTAKIADANVTTAKVADSAVTTAKIADNAVTTVKIPDSNITTAKIATNAVGATELANNAVDGPAIADNAVGTAKIVDGNITTAKLADSSVTTGKIANSGVTTGKIANNAVTVDKINDGEITVAKMDGSAVVTNSEQASSTPNDTSFLTTAASDGRYFRQDSTETITSGVTWSDSDAFVATTAAIDDRIIDLLDDVGGFTPIANETSFPTANPQGNTGTTQLVSIKTLSADLTPSSGTITIANGAGTGNTVTINNAGSDTLPSGFGVIVETTNTLHTYNFHRLQPKATEVTTVATNITNVVAAGANSASINNFADRYRVSAADPTARADGSSLEEGDLYYNTAQDVMKAFNGSSYDKITPDSSQLNDIAVVANDISTSSDMGSVADALIAGSSGGAVEIVSDTLEGAEAKTVTVAGGVFVVDGVSTPVLSLRKGWTYTFDQSDASNSNHPFAFKSGSSSYATGVTVTGTAGSTGAKVVFKVPDSATNLRYYCTVHGNGMGNTITVIEDPITANQNNAANITAVAGNEANINAVQANESNINTVAGISANVTTVAGISANVTTVAGNTSTINSVSSNSSNINTVAGSIGDVNRYANEYHISSSAPSSPSAGDLWFDETTNTLKNYNGSAWLGITSNSGIQNVSDDSSPELAGTLDCNDNNLTEVGTVSGNNLQIDFGTL